MSSDLGTDYSIRAWYHSLTSKPLNWGLLIRALGVVIGVCIVSGMLYLYLETIGLALAGRISFIPFVSTIPLLMLFGVLLLIPIRIIKKRKPLKYTYIALAVFSIIRYMLGLISDCSNYEKTPVLEALLILAFVGIIALHIKLITTPDQSVDPVSADAQLSNQ